LPEQTSAGAPTPSPLTTDRPAFASRLATRSTSGCAGRSRTGPNRLGEGRSTATARCERAPRSPS
jgi:hypothetical protein